MNQIKSDNIISLPFKYKEFIAKKEKGWDAYFFRVKQTLTLNRFLPMRDQPVFKFDYLIVGSNMLLNLISLHEITRKNIDNPINIGLYVPKELDYWAYDIVADNEILKKIKHQPQFKNCERMEDFFAVMVESIKKTKTKVFLLDERFRVSYVEYDNNNLASFFWFDNQKNNIAKNESFIEENNKIKLFINEKILNLLKNADFYHNVIWNFKNTFQKVKDVSTKNNYALAITQHVCITSLPQGWLNLKNDIKKDMVCFSSENHYQLIGTSKLIYFEKKDMENYCKEELINLIVEGFEKY